MYVDLVGPYVIAFVIIVTNHWFSIDFDQP